jgi:hypothetical protein
MIPDRMADTNSCVEQRPGYGRAYLAQPKLWDVIERLALARLAPADSDRRKQGSIASWFPCHRRRHKTVLPE